MTLSVIDLTDRPTDRALCPTHGANIAQPDPCRGCGLAVQFRKSPEYLMQMKEQRRIDAARARDELRAEKGLEPIRPHAFVDDGSGITCAECALPKLHDSHPKAVAAAVSEDAPERAPQYRARRLDQVVRERVEWVWQARIPRGKITVLDGDPGVGKSMLAIALAAHITTGRAWPDGAPCRQGAVLFLYGEDGVGDTLAPNLDAAGADSSRVLALDSVIAGVTDEGKPIVRDPHLGDVPQIEAAVIENGIALVVIDVLMAFLPDGTDSHKDQDVRKLLRRLKEMAERTGAAVLLLRHLNKAGGGHPLYRGGGSIGIVGAARSGLLAARDPDDAELVVVARTKNNLAAPVPSVSYRIVTDDHGARVEWAGPSERSAQDLLSGPSDEDPGEHDALTQWLKKFLRANDGKATAADCMRAATKAFGGPISKQQMKRARDRAGIKTGKPGMTVGWQWELPLEGLNSTVEHSYEGRK
jgi:putative DNA primase/helicase